MGQTDQALHDQAHDAFMAITLRLGKRACHQQKKAWDAWLARYIPQAEQRGLHDGVIQMRRNAARGCSAKPRRQTPGQRIRSLMVTMTAVGWEDLYQESLTIGAMYSYFADRMWRREGLRYLLPLIREVAAEYARSRPW